MLRSTSSSESGVNVVTRLFTARRLVRKGAPAPPEAPDEPLPRPRDAVGPNEPRRGALARWLVVEPTLGVA